MIYFDHNATTPLDERVLEAMLPFLQNLYGNASALYRLGRIARSAVETARAQVSTLVSAQPEQVIFTSGGTEANNLALQQLEVNALLLVSAIEHPSIMLPALHRQTRGGRLIITEVDTNGILKPGFLSNTSWHKGDLVSLQLANNETGVIQDLKQFTLALRDKNVLLHTDATQAAGKIPVHFGQLQAHMLTLSSHKLYGPKGCGALVVESGFKPQASQHGGGQEQGLRAGTENVAGIVGFGKAAELALNELDKRHQHLLNLRQQLEQGLKNIPGVVIFSETIDRLPNTIQWGLSGMDGEMLLMQLDRQGIAVSSGSACASGGGKPSPTLTAMGVSDALAKSALRVSLGYTNTKEEVTAFIAALKKLIPSN